MGTPLWLCGDAGRSASFHPGPLAHARGSVPSATGCSDQETHPARGSPQEVGRPTANRILEHEEDPMHRSPTPRSARKALERPSASPGPPLSPRIVGGAVLLLLAASVAQSSVPPRAP